MNAAHMEEIMFGKIAKLTIATVLIFANTASAGDLSLAYFMSPKHPMNAAVFTPFAEKLAEVSDGQLTVTQYPGGALNSVAPKQYSILLDSVADIVFTLPGYTGDIFPMTSVISMPGVCGSPTECTTAILRARSTLEAEYDAKLLAIWTNAPPILIMRDKPVRRLEDLNGMIIRVTSTRDIPFMEALGASAVTQPISVVNQNLTNGVIDGIAVDSSAIRSFSLQEPGNYLTTWLPGSGSAFVLLMNIDTYNALSDEARGWVDAASDDTLSMSGATGFEEATIDGMKIARDAGLEIIDLSDEEKARFNEAIAPVLTEVMQQSAGNMTIGEVTAIMKGE